MTAKEGFKTQWYRAATSVSLNNVHRNKSLICVSLSQDCVYDGQSVNIFVSMTEPLSETEDDRRNIILKLCFFFVFHDRRKKQSSHQDEVTKGVPHKQTDYTVAVTITKVINLQMCIKIIVVSSTVTKSTRQMSSDNLCDFKNFLFLTTAMSF